MRRTLVACLILAFAAHARTAFADTTPAAPAGTALIPADIKAFKPAIYVADKSTASVEPVAVEGRAFTQALRLTVRVPSAEAWKIGVNFPTTAPIRKGDVLWLTFQSRRIQTRKETGEAVGSVTFMMKNEAGKEVRPLDRSFTCGLDWIETSIPFVASHDAAPGAAALSIRFGDAVQSLEVGGIALINCGPKADPAKLPRTVPRYEGSAPDAAWRAAAFERIEKIRKGDLSLLVVDASGQPVPDATVAVRMRRHAFSWGAQIDARQIWDEKDPATAHVRETVSTYFNKVVFGNDLKWGRWINPGQPWGKAHALAALPWLEAHDIDVRGHVMVWPSWRQTPKEIFTDAVKKNPAAVRKAVLDHIDDQTSSLQGRLAEWDVVNETYQHHDILDLLGRDVMVDWFKRARAGAPRTRLFYNDYVMFQGSGPGSPSQYLYDTVKFLKDHGAPIDAIGEQAHFGASPPGPPQILATLDHFAELGLPIEFTEFDVDASDPVMQANFMRDVTIAAFSHPAVLGVVHWGVWEGNRDAAFTPKAALWTTEWKLRPHGQAWVDLVTKTWWTNADGRTAADGTYGTRGFYGDYDVTVTRGEKSATIRLKLSPGAATQTVVLK